MKNIFIYTVTAMVLTLAACKKDAEKVIREEVPLVQQMGPAPLMYSSLNVIPDNDGLGLSADFMTKWNRSVDAVAALSGRQLKSFMIKFISSSTLTISYSWLTAGGEPVTGVFSYEYVLNDRGELSLMFSSMDANAQTVLPALTDIKEGYLEKYAFKLDWIDDKIPHSREILGAYYRTDDPSSYFYGIVGVKKNDTEIADDSPLYLKMGIAPRPYSGITILSDPGKEQLSADFKGRWDAARDALFQLGQRRLKSFAIDFQNETELTITFSYLTAAGAAAKGMFTYGYTVNGEGLIRLTLISGNTNGNLIAPALTAITTGYLEQYAFKLDWIDDKITGSRELIAAYYRADDPSSFFHGELTKSLALFLKMGYDKEYTSLTVTPETPVAPLAPDFQERWETAKTALLANGGRQLKSFVLRFISTTQLTLTFTYLTSSGAPATAVFTYSYVIDEQGIMKLTFVSRNANGGVIGPSITSLTDDYLDKHRFRIDWFNPEHTLAAYYRADQPETYFYGSIGN